MNSTVVLSQSFVATTKGTNCSRTKQISCNLLTGSTSDSNFVRTARKEELSLNQAVNLGNHESCEFHVIRFGSSIITQISCNLHHFFLLSSGQGVYRARVRITQISRNSFWVWYNHANSTQFIPFFLLSSNPVKNRNQELKFARFTYKHKNLKLCTDGG